MRWLFIAIVPLVSIGALFAWFYPRPPESFLATPNLQRQVENSYSEHPQTGLPYDWLDCFESYQSDDAEESNRKICRSWTEQSVTSTLLAIRIDDYQMPVVESRLADATSSIGYIIDVQGGPGGSPFYSDPKLTEEYLDHRRENGMINKVRGFMPDLPEYQLLKRGFTIVSVGYWGTNIRTLNRPGEFQLAAEDVRKAVDFYSEMTGKTPPMVTTSLGNHLTLAALGKERLEPTNVLALVPVMDGLQHHINKFLHETSAKRIKAEKEGELFGEFVYFNIYQLDERGLIFESSQMLNMLEYVPRFMGSADYPWRDVTPKSACSRIALGTEDPRTKSYLAANPNPPGHVIVWEANHVLFSDVPDKLRALYAEFADCVIAEQG